MKVINISYYEFETEYIRKVNRTFVHKLKVTFRISGFSRFITSNACPSSGGWGGGVEDEPPFERMCLNCNCFFSSEIIPDCDPIFKNPVNGPVMVNVTLK